MKAGAIWAILVTSLTGFGDTLYLTVKHYVGGAVPCTIFTDCEKVLTSSYASIGPVPTALVGTIFYALVFLASVAYLDTRKLGWFRLVFALSTMGFFFSVWLVYLQVFVLHSLCTYCLLSAGLTTFLFFISMREWKTLNF